MNKKHAFTLFEVLVVTLIATILTTGILAVLSVGKESWSTGRTQIDVQQETRRAMERMVRELQQSGVSYTPKYPGQVLGLADDSTPYNSVTFRMSQGWDALNQWVDWGPWVTYTLGGLNGAQLLRTSGGSTTVLANGINSVQFIRTTNIVRIILQARKDAHPGQGRTIESTLRSELRLRN